MPAAAVGAVASVAGGAIAAHGAKKAAKSQARAANAATAEQRRQFDLINEQNAPYRQAGTAALNQLMQLYGLGGTSAPVPGRDVALGFEQWAEQNPLSGDYSGPIGVMRRRNDLAQQRRDYENYYNNFTPDPSGPSGGGAPDYSAFMNSPDYQFALQQGEQSLLRNRAALGGLQGGQTGAALQQYGQGLAAQQLGNYRNSLMGLLNAGQNSANLTAQAGLSTGQQIGQNMLYQGDAAAAGQLARTNAYGGAIGQLGGLAQQYFQNRGGGGLGPVDTSGLDPYRLGGSVRGP